MREVTFVGSRVTKKGVHTEEKKVAAWRNWPPPETPSQLRSFLGLAGYNRWFVDKFAHRTTALYELTKTDRRTVWRWHSVHQQQFEDIKAALTTTPMLATMDPDADFILRTDASDSALGGVLAQRQAIPGTDRFVERPLGFFSRKLHAVETRYPTYDRELLAIHDNLEHWAPYIHGRKHTTIYTDHFSLQHILGQRKLSGRQWRHLSKLQEHLYTINYYPGAANVGADALSRRNHPEQKMPTPAAAVPDSPISSTAGLMTLALHMTRMELEIESSAELLRDILTGLRQDEEFAPLITHFEMEAANASTRDRTTHLSQKQLRRRRRIAARARWFEWHDNLLYYKQGEDDFRLCIPDTVQDRVLRDLHDSELGGGHLGAAKLAHAIAQRFYWSGLHVAAKRWVSTCDLCHRIKPNNGLPYGLTMPLPIPGDRGECINIDFITKMPASENGNDAILTIVDSLTKRVRWVATKEEGLTAEAFADLFVEHYVRTRGLPAAIVSDRDPRFVSTFWRSVCERLGIKQKMSTAFHPQTDGLAENANGVVERFLKAYIASDPKHWDRHLPLAEFTYNASRHKALKTAPFIADIGRIPNLPLDLQLPTRPRSARTSAQQSQSEDFVDHLATVLRKVKQCLQNAQVEIVMETDKRRRPHPFKVGDSVFLNTRKLPIGYANLQHHVADDYGGGPASRKFQHEFAGPFTILDLRGNVATLDIPQNWLQPRTYNVDRLRLDRVDHGRSHPPPPALRSTKAGAEYEVEQLLDHRGNTVKTLQYHVKWAGQDPSEADWQPIANLRSGCKRFLGEYHQAHGLRVYKWMLEGDD
jgi:transposase InsO family protein